MKIKKSIITLLLLTFTVITASAQDLNKLTGSLLWKISGNGLAQPSYILGTHHLADTSFKDSIVGLENALGSTTQVVGELLLDDKQALQLKIQQEGMMPAGETYNDLLSPADYEVLDNALKSLFTVGMDQFGQLQPGILSLVYSVTMYSKLHPEFNAAKHVSIDEYVQKAAKEKGKSVLGLETADDQLYALLKAEPLKTQTEALICLVKNDEATKKSFDLLNKYYYSGNLMGMYNLAFNNPDEPCPMSHDQKVHLLKGRNDNWLKQLPEIMKNKSNLVAVGALHLAGEEGLLYQLEKMGYKVEAVK